MKPHLIIALAVIVLATSCAPSKSPIPANKKEAMDSFLAGTLDPSYAPAAFFVHFSSDAKEGDAAVKAHLNYFLRTNQDILKVQFEQTAPAIARLETEEDWNSIELMPVDFYRPTLEIIKSLQDIAGEDVYVLPTIYNPHQVARQSLWESRIVLAAKEHPEALKRLLDSYKEALLWLVDNCKEAGIEGFYMTTQGGEKKFYEIPGFFETFIKPYDLEIMGRCTQDTKLNILHICDWEGTFDDLTRFADYPGQIVNTPIRLDGVEFSTQDAYELFKRPVLGGLDKSKEIVKGSEEDVETAVRKALGTAPAGKIMIGAECTVSSAPWSNIHKAVYTSHHNR